MSMTKHSRINSKSQSMSAIHLIHKISRADISTLVQLRKNDDNGIRNCKCNTVRPCWTLDVAIMDKSSFNHLGFAGVDASHDTTMAHPKLQGNDSEWNKVQLLDPMPRIGCAERMDMSFILKQDKFILRHESSGSRMIRCCMNQSDTRNHWISESALDGQNRPHLTQLGIQWNNNVENVAK